MWETERMRRIHALGWIALAVIGLLVARLAWMQLFQGTQYKKIAEENRLRQIRADAPRGVMYDRNGAVLVTSRPSFAISIIPAEYTNPRDTTPVLANLLGVGSGDIDKALQDGQDFPYTPVRLKIDVDSATLTQIEERKQYLPGVIVEALPVRHYVYGALAAQAFGFISRINAEEYDVRKDKGYYPTDLIGKDGLERVWEDTLRGRQGGREVEVNSAGEEVGVIGDVTPVAGNGLVLTLDANLQKAAEDALASQIMIARQVGEPAKGGAVVVLDVRTGAVLVLANYPVYDPNLFATGVSVKDWNALNNDPTRPMSNRAIQNAYPPGSVFKIVTAAAALDRGLTNASEIFQDKGVYILNGWHFYGWETTGLGNLNLVDALAWSSDPVFYELGRRLGVDNLASYALTFGLGQPTGIQLLGEESGTVPTEAWKQSVYGESWYPGETLIAAIGQGYYLVTPIQQAMLLMAVANGGIMYRPRLVDRVISPDGNTLASLPPDVLRTVYLNDQTWGILRQGLEAVAAKGTAAYTFQGFERTLAGKTGSAETGRGTTHSWFACYTPADRPEIAVAAFVEDGGEGATAAVPIVRRVLEAYFGIPAPPLPVPPAGSRAD